ncbi:MULTISPECIES: helicase HerA-like domain-containing protein [unclassified Lysobacter]|uniref:helicase HerA-like domain-containing protein n=1 Tax=unclassified Lysobacter TaxID=2635362 RepID=UPI0006F92EA6|nr:MULTISPECIES: helicase HerA-like domain-containing protein [unclassified Lysobacter]KRA21025.1 ATP-binding protein [Lysobacter sp. Root604]KRD40030.1 ATP-binding protein [Lysobacter sp. Root916]KRD80059.1 ATP-binding protein [Lysobacter sp. Root983]
MDSTQNAILLGKAVTTPESGQVYLQAKLGNRHGLVAGATGTGKTVTLMTIAEGFSRLGVPVFLADVKGDVAGLAVAGTANDKLLARVAELGVPDWTPEASPTVFWDLFGKLGHPVRTTASEMGPTLLARILELNDTQSGVLDIVFKLADDRGLLLLDLKDLRALLALVAEERKDISTSYGLVSTQSVGAIQRALLRLEQEGGDAFFGEPALELTDLMRTAPNGRGLINILASDQLIMKPRLYSSFLLWLLSELFENLPEVGDLDKPKLVFVFDEAHLLFDDAPPALQQRVEQVVRIIRSKGVGVYFCSQFPDDVPDDILGQLGNRVQHALRAFTPRDQKAVKTAAETFVPNPALNVAEAISKLGTGEALVSTLQDKGVPMPVERTLIAPPRCRMGAITEAERAQVRAGSPVGHKYDTAIDRESASEMLAKRAETAATQAEAPPAKTREQDEAEQGGFGQAVKDAVFGTKRRQGMVETMAKQTARTVGNQIGRQILRGLLGGIFGGRK